MRFPDLLSTALTALWRRKFHASLTVLGVLIGITAMVVMISLGIGLAAVQDGFIEKQANLRQVEVTGVPQGVSRGQKQRMDEATLLELRRIPGVKRSWPFYDVNASARIGGADGSVRIRAIPAYAMTIRGLRSRKGSCRGREANCRSRSGTSSTTRSPTSEPVEAPRSRGRRSPEER